MPKHFVPSVTAIRETVFEAEFLYEISHPRIVDVADVGKQVVLDLILETGADQPANGAGTEVDGGGGLQQEVI
jgi:hypothetical protein